jgi:predicted negative regulator of RcsB-dependent stress response
MNTNSKIKSWFKNNWIVIVLVCIVGALALLAWRQFSFSESYEELLNKKYMEQAASFKKQIDEIEKTNQDWQNKQNELNKNYEKEIQRIETEYRTELDKITKRQRSNQVKIIDEAKKDPSTLTKKLEDVFGIHSGDNQ